MDRNQPISSEKKNSINETVVYILLLAFIAFGNDVTIGVMELTASADATEVGTIALTAPADATETGESSGSHVKTTAEETVATDAETQQKFETWAEEKAALLEQIDDITVQLERVQWKQEKTDTYQTSLEAKITDLNRRALEMAEVETALLPLLEDAVVRLEQRMENEIPMDLEGRNNIVTQTRNMLNDYDATLLDKTRAVLEAVSREVDVGYTVQVKEDEIMVAGQPRQVKLLRVGRVGLFALTLDAEQAFSWNRADSRFEALPRDNVREITEAMEMAEGVRIIELSRLPITLPELKNGDLNDSTNGEVAK